MRSITIVCTLAATFLQTTFTYCRKFSWGAKFRRLVTKITKISTPQKLPAIRYYSRKIWRGIKFGGLAVCVKTAKLKSAKIFYTCMYIWRYRTIPPNLIPIMVLKTSFWAKPPNLMTANISGYTVYTALTKVILFYVTNGQNNIYNTGHRQILRGDSPQLLVAMDTTAAHLPGST